MTDVVTTLKTDSVPTLGTGYVCGDEEVQLVFTGRLKVVTVVVALFDMDGAVVLLPAVFALTGGNDTAFPPLTNIASNENNPPCTGRAMNCIGVILVSLFGYPPSSIVVYKSVKGSAVSVSLSQYANALTNRRRVGPEQVAAVHNSQSDFVSA